MFTPIIKAEDYPEISAAIDRLAEWNLYDSDENSLLIQSELCKIYGNLIKISFTNHWLEQAQRIQIASKTSSAISVII